MMKHSGGNTFSLLCKSSNFIGERKRGGWLTAEFIRVLRFSTMTRKPLPMPLQAASKFASSHICTCVSKQHMPFTTADPFVFSSTPPQFALTQVQDTAAALGTTQCQMTLRPSYNLSRVPSKMSQGAQQLCSLSPTS